VLIGRSPQGFIRRLMRHHSYRWRRLRHFQEKWNSGFPSGNATRKAANAPAAIVEPAEAILRPK
jgi:hypothetical protein